MSSPYWTECQYAACSLISSVIVLPCAGMPRRRSLFRYQDAASRRSPQFLLDQRAPEMRHRDRHVFLHALAADPQARRGFGMAQPLDLVKAERTAGAWRQRVDRPGEPIGILA